VSQRRSRERTRFSLIVLVVVVEVVEVVEVVVVVVVVVVSLWLLKLCKVTKTRLDIVRGLQRACFYLFSGALKMIKRRLQICA
jgi:hypothetical protein